MQRTRESAQGALEYLLLIGGAVIVAAVVLTLVTGLTATGQQAVGARVADVLCAPFGRTGCGLEDPDGTGSFSPLGCVWSNPRKACTSTTLGNGAIAFFALEEETGNTAIDSSENANTGTITGSVRTAGKKGSGLQLNGTVSDYIIVNPAKSFPATEITVAFWMKTTGNNPPGEGTPISYAVATQDNEVLFYDYRNFSFYVAGSPSFGPAPGGVTISANDGQWHHIAMTWKSSNGEIKVFKDAQQVAQGTGYKTGTSINPNGAIVVGQEQDSVGGSFQGTRTFKGTIDEIGIWNRALSQAEILELYNSGA